MDEKISDIIAAYDAEHPPESLYDRRLREVAEQRAAEDRAAQKAREAKREAARSSRH
jgi:hypothetical protein